jgi:FkbM family methyltransferase
MNNINPNIYYIEESNLWWSKNDIGAYDYLKKTNSNYMNIVSPYFNETKVAVQAGGHCGWMVKELKKYFETIYTFEPNSVEFLCLCMNLPEDNIFKIQACVGNEHQLVRMRQHPWGSGANHIEGEGNVPVFKIDDLKLNACDFIQLDLEGYEYYALLGALETIKKYKPLICIERSWYFRYNVTNEMLDELFKSLGYIFIKKVGEEVNGETVGDADYLYKFQEKD